jgi:MFS family permease
MSEAATAQQAASPVRLGLKENWPQFALLVLINAFVGGMVGIERTVVPLIGSEEFRISSTTLVVSFIVSFGVVKACANLVSGQLADAWGRKRVLVLGWLAGLPVPFMIIWAPGWEWVIAANALLGINQGLAWSMTVIMKIDLVGPKSRGLAVGLNEFAGYLAVGVTAFLTGYLASQYGLRPAPIYLGVAYAILGSALSILLVHDTREHVRLEAAAHAQQAAPIGFREIFLLTSIKDRNLFAASQAGLVNNLNDGMSWGIFPLFFASFGLHVDRIGILKAVYPATWGILQIATGPLSDRWGRKGLIVAGMWVQAVGLFLTAATSHFEWWLVGSLLLGLGTAMVYPSLIAAVSDASHPSWRARSLSVYRFWRDLGYAIGALSAGIIADLFGMAWAIGAIGALTFLSGAIVFVAMEARPGARQ